MEKKHHTNPMLDLHPESDLTLSPVVLGSAIATSLSPSKYEFIDSVMKEFLSADPRRSTEQFMDSLTMLYALGLVEYFGHRIKLPK